MRIRLYFFLKSCGADGQGNAFSLPSTLELNLVSFWHNSSCLGSKDTRWRGEKGKEGRNDVRREEKKLKEDKIMKGGCKESKRKTDDVEFFF